MEKYLFLIQIFLISNCTIPSEKNEIIENHQSINKTMEFYSGAVVFYNVENLFDTENDFHNEGDDNFTPNGTKSWDDHRYFEKLSRIADAISFNGNEPLIIGFAEIEKRKVLKDLLLNNRFKNHNYQISHFDSEDNRGIDCGLIYNADYFQLIKESRLTVSIDNEPSFRTRDILYVQGLVNQKDKLHVFVNHWSSRKEGKEETEDRRFAAATILRAKIDELLLNEPSAKIIVMGDFNDEPADKSLNHILKAKNHKEAAKSDLINLFLNEKMQDKGTIVFNREWSVFDQLIVSQGLYNSKNGIRINENKAYIESNDKLIYTYPDGGTKPNSSFGGNNYFGGFSDHLPVYLILENK